MSGKSSLRLTVLLSLTIRSRLLGWIVCVELRAEYLYKGLIVWKCGCISGLDSRKKDERFRAPRAIYLHMVA